MSAQLSKPPMRRLLLNSLKVHIPLALVFSLAAGFTFKVFVRDARRDKVAEFYR